MSEDTTANNGQGFVYGEVELAGVTGIGVKVLQKKRGKKLRQGVDWDLAGLRVAYSAAGLVAILQAVTGKEPVNGEIAGVRLTELEERTKLRLESSGEKGRGPEGPNVRTARVQRLFPNPYIIECLLEGSETELPEVVVVRVKTSKNFRRGMEVPLRLDGGSGRYELARRLPRFAGKW